jgi:hypothetical protein
MLTLTTSLRGFAEAFGGNSNYVIFNNYNIRQSFAGVHVEKLSRRGRSRTRNVMSESPSNRIITTRISLVSEEDVLEAVEQAEALWAQALEARKTANALSDRAEEEAEAAAGTAKEAENIFQNRTQPVTMEQLVQVDAAAKSNLDATSMVNRALRASEDADRLEQLAEEALRKSEECLEQHLKDFPDSPLALDD